LSNSKNPYKILGINEESSEIEIKKSFRKLAHKYHPDKSDLPNAVKIFQLLISA
tara:strand:- start:298 stop:459 length:162 start_codon:yes stop_codon:yes gene_type:complete